MKQLKKMIKKILVSERDNKNIEVKYNLKPQDSGNI